MVFRGPDLLARQCGSACMGAASALVWQIRPSLFDSGLTLPRLATLIGIPERTLARRKASGKLTTEESERLLRIAGIFEDAVDLFEGDVPAAVNWLTTLRKALGDRPPLSYARTEPGAREVENLIGRLEHGIFS